MNEALCERLKLPVIRSERIIVKTFGNNEFQARYVNVVLIKFFTGYKNGFVEAICSPVICADLTNQNCKIVSKRYSHLRVLNLADKSTDGSKTIEILVGLDYYFEFITGEVIKGKFGEPVALKSIFGYILSGQYKNHSTVHFSETHFLKIHTETNVNFRQQPFDTNVNYSFNEAYYDKSVKERSYLISEFQNNLKYSGSRYEVKLPFIGENKTRQLFACENENREFIETIS